QNERSLPFFAPPHVCRLHSYPYRFSVGLSFAAEFFALFHSLFDRSRAINAGGIDPESGPTLSRVRSSRALPITPGRFLVAGSIKKSKSYCALARACGARARPVWQSKVVRCCKRATATPGFLAY